ncbi:MAG TPA: acyl carrier protein [Labilithrix sp.]|nr:acyl carrier protein [Labilithrix sp.]
MRDDVMKKLSEILVRDFRVSPGAIRDEANFRTHLKLDSLSLVDLVYLVEKDFGFKATVPEFRDLHTVGALANFIVTKLAKTP